MKKKYSSDVVRDIAQRRRRGIDALEIIPLVDLSVFREETINRIHRGLIPSSYHWSRKKTEQAYSYKNYGDWARCIIVGAKYYLTDEEYPHDSAHPYSQESSRTIHRFLKNPFSAILVSLITVNTVCFFTGSWAPTSSLEKYSPT